MSVFSPFAIHTVPLIGDTAENKRQEVKETLLQTWQTYESLFALLNNDEAFYQKPDPLRHPLIFYYAHTAVFYINKLRLIHLIDQGIHSKLESLCAVGVDEMSWDDLDERHYNWPSVQTVKHYRDQALNAILEQWQHLPLKLPITQRDPAWVFLMGIEHERIHLETSSVLIRQLPLKDITLTKYWQEENTSHIPPMNRLLDVPAQNVVLGKQANSHTYGWDNEYGHHQQQVVSFEAAQYLVTNSEFLAFVEDGGYEKSEYWCTEGNDWRIGKQAKLPHFWQKKNDKYLQRNLTQVIPLPLDWPVEVNQLEASAFCRWLSEKTQRPFRLPTEIEWHALHQHTQPKEGNRGLHSMSSCSVTQHNHAHFFDVVGNVWQWTNTPISGFSGFQVHPWYDDFSTPTFDGKHAIMKGGSWISTGNELETTARYAFRRHFHQHAGFRYVCGDPPEETTISNPYETDQLVAQYLDFHYSENGLGIENFSTAAIKISLQHIVVSESAKILDVGCAVGRSSFEWGKYANHVDAVDFSARFIQHAHALQKKGHTHYAKRQEGDLTQHKHIYLENLYPKNTFNHVSFSQGDASNLKPQYTNYDVIYASNLLDRLSHPAQFLQHILSRLNPNGYLILLSPYTWLEEYTAKDQWLGGYKRNGETHTTFDALKEQLLPHCTLCHQQDVPFVIAETARKYQYTFSDLTIWQKKE
jgi:5-histidylcysteine sulfoxide synthase/putative 4-mercaptohistidine N1-methyltranferase